MLKREAQAPTEHDCPCCRQERASGRSALWILTMITLLSVMAMAVTRCQQDRSRLEIQQCMGLR